MRLPFYFDIAPRDALAAPTKTDQTRVQSLVILFVSIVSALGAAWIMLSFVCFKSLRSFRHQLILGLAISDLVMALNFLSSSAMDVGGRYIGGPEQTRFCSFNGWMTQVFVIQTDYWVLTIAICTYFILADYKIASSWVQDHRWLLFGLPWLLSTLWASIGLGVAGYGNIGAWCWFTSDEVRLLVNFVPRWIIIVLMLAMYARLYLVLFRAHNRFVSFDNSSSGNPSTTIRSRDIIANHADLHSGPHNGDQANEAHVSGQGSQPQRTNRRLKRLARLMLMYPVAYMLVWTLPTSIRIYQATTGRPAPFALQTIDKACIVIQGLVDAVIYGLNESSLSSWRNLIWPTSFPTLDGTSVSAGGSTSFSGRKYPRIPSARLSDHATSDGASSSSLNITSTATNDSSARITLERQGGIEMRAFKQTEHDLGAGDIGSGIRKTVEVKVASSSAPRTPQVSFFRA